MPFCDLITHQLAFIHGLLLSEPEWCPASSKAERPQVQAHLLELQLRCDCVEPQLQDAGHMLPSKLFIEAHRSMI